MTADAPERIWAYSDCFEWESFGEWDLGNDEGYPGCSNDWPHQQYIRADISEAKLDRAIKELEWHSKQPEAPAFMRERARIMAKELKDE